MANSYSAKYAKSKQLEICSRDRLERDALPKFVCCRNNETKKDTKEGIPETKRTIMKKGFMNYGNVILMNESFTEDIFNETREKCTLHFGDYICSLDSMRLSILTLELIKIYEFRLGKLFVGKVTNESILQNKILEDYLRTHRINPKYFEFELPIF